MDVPSAVYVVSCHVMLAMCICMIYHKRYDDGLFGRVALAVLVITCVLVLADFWLGGDKSWGAFAVSPTTAAYAFGTALFMLRHVLRFWKFRWRCPVLKGADKEIPYA